LDKNIKKRIIFLTKEGLLLFFRRQNLKETSQVKQMTRLFQAIRGIAKVL
jgi:hypothetical protein